MNDYDSGLWTIELGDRDRVCQFTTGLSSPADSRVGEGRIRGLLNAWQEARGLGDTGHVGSNGRGLLARGSAAVSAGVSARTPMSGEGGLEVWLWPR